MGDARQDSGPQACNKKLTLSKLHDPLRRGVCHAAQDTYIFAHLESVAHHFG